MNRDTRAMVVVGVAVLTAALASFGMYVALRRTAVTTGLKTYIVVAKKSLAMGAVIAEADLKLMEWPKDGPLAGAFTSLEQVRGKALISSVLENEPLTKIKLAEGGSGLTPIIHPGMRAMSVKVNEVIGVAGFVTPGTRVDVVVTLRQDRDFMSRVVVQNVEVLTAGAKYDDPEARRQGKPIPSTVVTLMVSPDQAEQISLAASQGQIMLALRNPLDKELLPRTRGYTTNQLMGGGAVPPPPLAAPPIAERIARERPRVPVPGVARPQPCEAVTFKAGKEGKEVVPCA
jgi:pilus assembly protein CpaB